MSKKISFGGIFTGIGVVLLYLAAIVPTGKATFYFLSALPVVFTIIEFGTWTGILVYAAISLLSFLLVGNPIAVLPFIFIFGHYGIFKYYIERRRHMAVEILLKLVVFNFSVLAAYFVYTGILSGSVGLTSLSTLTIVLILIALQCLFFVNDYILSMMIGFYQNRIKTRLSK